MRKILYSPGYGAGWSTWMGNVPPKFACEYQPIIEALERGEKLLSDGVSKYNADITDYHPAIQRFVKDCQEKFNETPYLGGVEGLTIEEVEYHCLIQIREYDGNEHVEIMSEGNYF